MSDRPVLGQVKRQLRVERTRQPVNISPEGHMLTSSAQAWTRLARYVEIAESGDLGKLLVEIDANLLDQGIHMNAVLLNAVRLLAGYARSARTHAMSLTFMQHEPGRWSERYFLTEPDLARRRLMEYLDIAHHEDLERLLGRLELNVADVVVHPAAVLFNAVRLLGNFSKRTGRSVVQICLGAAAKDTSESTVLESLWRPN